MFKKFGFLALVLAVAGAVMPTAAFARDGYNGARQSYARGYRGEDRPRQEFRGFERRGDEGWGREGWGRP